MAVTLVLTSSVRDRSGTANPVSGSAQYSGSSVLEADKEIAASQTDSAVAMAFAHASVVFGYIVADNDCQLQTNSAGSPVDTINLSAGVPLIWEGGADSDPFSANVTAWYVTTPSGPTVHFQAFVLMP